MNKPNIRRYPDPDQCCLAAAEHIARTAAASVAARGYFTLVLSGGNTPRLLHRHLVSPPFADRIPWDKTHLFWGDERLVPATDPDSNYAMAASTLIAKIDIPAANIHPMPVDLQNHQDGARAYEKTIRTFFTEKSGEELPCFDLILLGMGPDGHTASLFPSAPALDEQERWVVAVEHPNASPPVPRLTLTLPIINNARQVLFILAGAEKNKLLRLITDDPARAARSYPAALVQPKDRLFWYTADE